MQIISGTAIAEKVLEECRRDIAVLAAVRKKPGLAVVLIGDDPASRAYVRSKDKKCRDLGLHSVKLELPVTTTQEQLLAHVEALNNDPAIHGILVQSPPPPHIDEAAIVGTGWIDEAAIVSTAGGTTNGEGERGDEMLLGGFREVHGNGVSGLKLKWEFSENARRLWWHGVQ